MKRFRVVYLPHGKEDKEWTFVGAKSRESLQKAFTMGIIVSVEDAPDEDDE